MTLVPKFLYGYIFFFKKKKESVLDHWECHLDDSGVSFGRRILSSFTSIATMEMTSKKTHGIFLDPEILRLLRILQQARHGAAHL